MTWAKLADLPPEVLDHIIAYLPTANSVANLGATSRHLQGLVENHAWQTFNRNRFPSLCPSSPPSHRDAARTLTSLSAAWDRRALVARYIAPDGDIRTYPGGNRLEKWVAPTGQTMGFVPKLDVYENIGSQWSDRSEVLAFSTGAELCIRYTGWKSKKKRTRWISYRPPDAREGRDDITCLHLLHSSDPDTSSDFEQVITGTANGDLRLIKIPKEDAITDVKTKSFSTNGQSVQSSSILYRNNSKPLLTAGLSNDRIAIYSVDTTEENQEVLPKSEILIGPSSSDPVAAKQQKIWSTTILGPEHIAVGVGPSQHPIQVYAFGPSGILENPIRRFALKAEASSTVDIHSVQKSSVYPIIPLEPESIAGSSTRGATFLSGATDGLIRLHDLRSPRDAELVYHDSNDDGAVYSLICRGRETLVAGTNRHRLLKFFDMRLGSKAYSYTSARPGASSNRSSWYNSQTMNPRDWNLFVRSTGITRWGRNTGGNTRWQRNQVVESSIYSLAASSPHSPFLYVGAVSAVMELASVSTMDDDPDPVFFTPWTPQPPDSDKDDEWHSRDVLDLAMYDRTCDMKLYTQKSMWETWRSKQSPTAYTCEFPKTEGLDERWKVG